MKLYNPRGVLWRLEPYEVWLAQCVAWRRTKENRNNAHNYQGVAHLEAQPFAELAGACCEMAVASRLNRYWGGLAWKSEEHPIYSKRVADVSDCVEVKRVRNPDGDVKFTPIDLQENRWIFLCHPMFYNPNKIDTVWVDIIGYQRARYLEPLIHNTRETRTGLQFCVKQEFLTKLPIEPNRPPAMFTNKP